MPTVVLSYFPDKVLDVRTDGLAKRRLYASPFGEHKNGSCYMCQVEQLDCDHRLTDFHSVISWVKEKYRKLVYNLSTTLLL